MKLNKIHTQKYLSEPLFFLHLNDLNLCSLFLDLKSKSITDTEA